MFVKGKSAAINQICAEEKKWDEVKKAIPVPRNYIGINYSI
jgi:hypothetical protein